MATPKLLSMITISSLLSLSQSSIFRYLCFGCFCARQNHKEETKIHPMSNTFDNCLQTEETPLNWTANYSYTRQLSPESSIRSSMNLLLNETLSDIHTVAAPSITTGALPANVTWFDIDSLYITQNSSIIKSNMNIYLINIIIYDITHFLYFLGHYLPLNNTAIATEFQIIFDYFAQFQYGDNSVNLRNVVQNYESIRHKTLNLLNEEHVNESPLNIPTHVIDFDAKSSLSNIYKHRKRMRKAHLAPRVRAKLHSDDSTAYSTISRISCMDKHFWNTDWLDWIKKPLAFSGCHPKETNHCCQMLLLRVCYEMDKVHKILTGYDNKDSGLKSIRDHLKFRKSAEVFLMNYFNGSFIEYTYTESAMKIYASLEDRQKKLIMALRQSFIMDILNFVLSSSVKKRTKRNNKFKLQLMGMKSTQLFYSQIQFDAALFGGYRSCKGYMMVISRYLVDLLQDKRAASAMKFRQIQDKGGVLFLLNVILQYALVGGRCGYAFDEKDTGYQVSIVCEISVLDLNEEGSNAQITEKLKIPRKFMEKGTDDYWVVLKDFTGLNFEDIEKESDSTEDSERMMDGYIKTPRNKHGITIKDLQRHNWNMRS